MKLYSTGRFAGTLRFYANDDAQKEKSCIDLAHCRDIRWATNGSNCSQLQIVTPKETFSIETTGTKRPIKHERASAEMWRSAIARILTVAKARRLEDQHRMDARRHLCEEGYGHQATDILTALEAGPYLIKPKDLIDYVETSDKATLSSIRLGGGHQVAEKHKHAGVGGTSTPRRQKETAL